MNKISHLIKEGKILEIEGNIYLLFEDYPLGKNFLNFMFESVLMEEPINPTEDSYAWHDGRRSVFRDLKIIINRVKKILEESMND